jgi:hypothetical protein
MITIEDCRKTLNQNGPNYTTQELEKILEFLKNLSEFSLNQYKNRHGKGSNLHPGFNR